MRRAGYEDEESDWIDALCCAMNRWAMATAKIEAEARLWAMPGAGVVAAAAVASAPEPAYHSDDAEIPSAVIERQQSVPNLRERTGYVRL